MRGCARDGRCTRALEFVRSSFCASPRQRSTSTPRVRLESRVAVRKGGPVNAKGSVPSRDQQPNCRAFSENFRLTMGRGAPRKCAFERAHKTNETHLRAEKVKLLFVERKNSLTSLLTFLKTEQYILKYCPTDRVRHLIIRNQIDIAV
jgi:hypothetical protein